MWNTQYYDYITFPMICQDFFRVKVQIPIDKGKNVCYNGFNDKVICCQSVHHKQ